jgi:PhoH-like ATPase
VKPIILIENLTVCGMKSFILDTTILLHDPQALFAFGDNDVCVPISVIESIDRFKKDVNETGRNARQSSRLLDQIRSRGSLVNGVKLDNNGILRISTCPEQAYKRVCAMFNERSGDLYVLAVALYIKEQGKNPAILVTKDINLRIKADALGVVVEDYESDKVDIEELYSGTADILCDGRIVDAFVKEGKTDAAPGLLPNQYVTLIDQDQEKHIALGRFDSERNRILGLYQANRDVPMRVDARNREQAFAIDALLNDSIGLVTLLGKAGTGKTLLAIAAAIYKTVDENVFNRILVSRPTLPMGKDIGFLPGTIDEKLTPWMHPIADNVELILRSDAKARRQIRGFRELVDMGIMVIEPLTYIRGRSIHHQYLIVDEAQNLTPHEIKTIITRAGEGTKIVLTGDPYQIDNIYIDSSSNGLTYVVERFKNQTVSAHVTMKKGERSVLSELAANLL